MKLLNEKGEFLNAAEGNQVLEIAARGDFLFADVDHLGKVTENFTYTQKHIESVLALDLVDVEAIRAAGFTVAVDCVNSVGGKSKSYIVTRTDNFHIIPNHCLHILPKFLL